MAAQMPCVNKDTFYQKLDELKASRKTSKSKVNLFIDDELYDKATQYLQNKETEVHVLTQDEINTIKRKKWNFKNEDGKIVSKEQKYVVPKRELHEILCHSHSAIAHRGRDKLENYIKNNYAEIPQIVVKLFVSLCSIHEQQKSVADHLKKPVVHPIIANKFLSHVQIDLIDMRRLPCSCSERHKWILHITDHHTKFSWLFPLISKQTEQVISCLNQLFWQWGFPKKLHSDNGKEFKNQKMSSFCQSNNIKQVHGAPRTPTTQGLVERNNKTIKENIRNILTEKKESYNNWCTVLGEAAYKKNITVHRAVAQTPYELVLGIKPWREEMRASVQETDTDKGEQEEETNNEQQRLDSEDETVEINVQQTPTLTDENSTDDIQTNEQQQAKETKSSRSKKRQKIKERQEQYNKKMKQSRPKVAKFHVNDYVKIKIDKVDKTPLHPNTLLGKIISIEPANGYAQVVTEFGVIDTQISPSRLHKSQNTGIALDYSKHITFSRACKMAINQ